MNQSTIDSALVKERGWAQWCDGGDPVALHRAGRIALAEGEYADAIELFRRAAQLAPQWPEATYDEATAHVLVGNLVGAQRAYEATSARFPRGFFATNSRYDALQRERRGAVPAGTTRWLLDLDWVRQLDDRRAYVMDLVHDAPGLPQAWLELSRLEQRAQPRLEAIERGLACSPDPDTRAQLEIENALARNEAGRTDEAVACLRQLVGREDVSVAAEERAHLLLARWAPT